MGTIPVFIWIYWIGHFPVERHLVAALCYGGCHLGSYGVSPVEITSDLNDINSRQEQRCQRLTWHCQQGWPHNFRDGSLHNRGPPLDGAQLESGQLWTWQFDIYIILKETSTTMIMFSTWFIANKNTIYWRIWVVVNERETSRVQK